MVDLCEVIDNEWQEVNPQRTGELSLALHLARVVWTARKAEVLDKDLAHKPICPQLAVWIEFRVRRVVWFLLVSHPIAAQAVVNCLLCKRATGMAVVC